MILLIYFIILMDVLNAVVITHDGRIRDWIAMRNELVSAVPTIRMSGDSQWSVALKPSKKAHKKRVIEAELCDGYFADSGFFMCENCFKGATTDMCNYIIIPSVAKRIMLGITIRNPDTFGPIYVYDGAENTNRIDQIMKTSGTHYFESTGRSMLIQIHIINLRNVSHLWSMFYDTNPEELTSPIETKGCVEQIEAPSVFRLPSERFGPRGRTKCTWYVTNPYDHLKTMTIQLPECIPADEENCVLRFITVYSGHGLKKERLTKFNDTSQSSFEIKQPSAVVEYFGCLTAMPLEISVTLSP